jgi:hypothetical protein
MKSGAPTLRTGQKSRRPGSAQPPFSVVINPTNIYEFGAFLLGGVVLSVVISRRCHLKDLRVYLEPDLKKAGMEFVSAVHPDGLLNCGPFPRFEVGGCEPTGNFSAAGVQTSGIAHRR